MSEVEEGYGRKLTDLRVVDLRAELEKRGLDQKGVKKDLVERLQKALENEGHDAENFVFDVSADKKPPKRLSSTSSSVQVDSAKPEAEGKVDDEKLEKVEKQTEKQQPGGEEVLPEKEDKLNEDDGMDKKSEPEDGINLTLDEEDNIRDENTDDLAENSDNHNDSDVLMKTAPNEKVSNEAAASNKECPTSSSAQTQQRRNEEAAAPANSNSSQSEVSSPKKSPASLRLLWISNVPKNTRANELKQLLSAHGKVVCAKVVVNARFPGSCCYGYVTMGTAEDAVNVIDKLNNTEFNGQIIKIDKFETVKADSIKWRKSKEDAKDDDSGGAAAKMGGEPKEKTVAEQIKDDRENRKRESPEARKSRTSDRSSVSGKHKSSTANPRDKTNNRPPGPANRPGTGYKGNVLTFNKIKEERERQRLRERERAMREDSRRRRQEEALRLKEMRQISRRQRSEAERLEREREKLRLEREKIEREKSELIKLERERQKIEREKLEMERMELQRSRLRLEEDKRTIKRRVPTVPPAASSTYRRDDNFEHDRKRPAPAERHFPSDTLAPRFEPPPIPHDTHSKKFKRSSPYEKHDSFPDQKRSSRDYTSERSSGGGSTSLNRSGGNSSSIKYDNSRSYDNVRDRDLGSSRDPIQSTVSLSRSKDSRYGDRDRSPHFRPVSDSRDRPSKTDRDHHYSNSNSSDRWGGHSVSSQPKSFISNTQKSWSSKGSSWRPDPPSIARWNNGGNSNTSRSSSSMNHQSFSGGSNVGPSCPPPPPPGINSYSDRFDYNKSSNRKY